MIWGFVLTAGGALGLWRWKQLILPQSWWIEPLCLILLIAGIGYYISLARKDSGTELGQAAFALTVTMGALAFTAGYLILG